MQRWEEGGTAAQGPEAHWRGREEQATLAGAEQGVGGGREV